MPCSYTCALPHFSWAPSLLCPQDKFDAREWPPHRSVAGPLCILYTFTEEMTYRKQVGWVSSYLICCGGWWQSCGNGQHPQGGLQLLGSVERSWGFTNGLWAVKVVKGHKYLETVSWPASFDQPLLYSPQPHPIHFFPAWLLCSSGSPLLTAARELRQEYRYRYSIDTHQFTLYRSVQISPLQKPSKL